MPNQNNNLDPELLNQLPQYKASIDSLRDAVNNLNKEIGNSTDKFTKLNAQNKESVNWGSKIKSSVKDLADTYTSFGRVIDVVSKVFKTGSEAVGIAEEAFTGWVGIAAAAFTLITTYGPQVLDFLGGMFQSDKIKEASKNLKIYNDMMDNYIENVSGGLAEVNLLKGIASNTNQFHNVRVEALQKMISLSPQHLKNLTLENIATKEGRDMIDEYTKSLKRKSLEESAQIQAKPLEANREKLEMEVMKAKKSWQDTSPDAVVKHEGLFTTFTSLKDDREKAYREKLKQYDAAVKQLNNITNNTNKDLVQLAAKPSLNKTKNKEYWENLITQQQNEIDKYDSSSKDFIIKTKPFADRINQARKILELYNVKPNEKSTPKTGTTKKSAVDPQAEEKVQTESADRMTLLLLDGYAKEVLETNQHFNQLRELHKGNNATVEQLEKERVATLDSINKKFQSESLTKLHQYEADLNKTSKDARQEAFDQLNDDYKKQADDVRKIRDQNLKVVNKYDTQIFNLTLQREALAQQSKKGKTDEQIAAMDKQAAEMDKQLNDLNKKYDEAKKIVAETEKVSGQLSDKHQKDLSTLTNSFKQEDSTKQQSALKDDIQGDKDSGNQQKEFADRQKLLDLERKQAEDSARAKGESVTAIDDAYNKKQAQLDKDRLAAQVTTQKQYLQSLDSVANTMKGIFGKNTIAAKAAFKAHQAAAAAQVIIDTRQSIMGIWSADSPIPFVGVPKAIAETAIVAAAGASNLATILKQKPGFAQGGQYVSDGRGALLPGYSRTDNTNAYLRSGEAVVVSEAMRNPWARNLVSAINVAHGGRDFSLPNPGNGYAIGGIFTDGGNANRYYSQPMNDVKDLANTMAYQMINNFPPIYVDVKDVNNQQNILAQTVNRVNL